MLLEYPVGNYNSMGGGHGTMNIIKELWPMSVANDGLI